ncbi:MAG TPA: type II secretion system protein [Pyrinomonadaceae bacterium]|nr:type II secretion system protein [Pyrinomonadaceae bacterium]
MNLEAMSDHNICGSSVARSKTLSATISRSPRRSERGYTLVALLALMSVVALFAMAVAPRVSQQAQREREKEAIFRGEQVADAIGQYYLYRIRAGRPPGDQALPSSMEDLLNGIPVVGGAKNRQILRPSAARDPLTLEGEWRFIGPRTQGLVEFQQSILFYTGSFLPQPRGQLADLQRFAVPPITSVLKIGEKPESSSSSSIDDVSSGPFVGVASRSRKDSVLTYYGIERHDQWIFTPLFRN